LSEASEAWTNSITDNCFEEEYLHLNRIWCKATYAGEILVRMVFVILENNSLEPIFQEHLEKFHI